MTILEELKRYAYDCIDDKIVSCKKHKWACERFLKDIQKENYKYRWNEEKAEKIVKWFTYLRHSKGILAGQPIIAYNLAKIHIVPNLWLGGQRRNKKI